jgi:hypothetical protein
MALTCVPGWPRIASENPGLRLIRPAKMCIVRLRMLSSWKSSNSGVCYSFRSTVWSALCDAGLQGSETRSYAPPRPGAIPRPFPHAPGVNCYRSWEWAAEL